MQTELGHKHNFVEQSQVGIYQKRTLRVIILTSLTMFGEIYYGIVSGSMALLADGWHMGTHVGALLISYLSYHFASSDKWSQKFSFGAGKLIPLGGYTNGLILSFISLFMLYESVNRIFNPVRIQFSIAIYVTVIGLVINLLSALLLTGNPLNQDHHEHDSNFKGAIVHVLSDALTSVLALVALLLGQYFGYNWMDPAMGILGGVIIFKWSISLIKESAWGLLDGESKYFKKEDIEAVFSENKDIQIADLHIWQIAPKAHACEVIVYNKVKQGPDFYRDEILKTYKISHIIIEERLLTDASQV